MPTCAPSGPIVTTPGTHAYTVNAVDGAGNAASKTVTYVVDPDTTPPTISITSPIEGQHFAEGATINAAFTCDDTQTGRRSAWRRGRSTTSVGTHAYTVNATDGAGNTATKTVNYTIDPDVTPPTISITSPGEGQHYALGATINVAFTCDDTQTGTPVCEAAAPIDYSVGTHAYTVNATDGAGNTATKSVNYTIDPDTTKPTITITSPVDGRHYPSGTTFPGTFSCDDAGGSGVASCAPATGIDLTVGTHVFTVNAADRAGNTATKSVTYFVDAPPVTGGEAPTGGTPTGGTPTGGTPTGNTPTGTQTPTESTTSTTASTPSVTVPSRASTTGLTRGVSISLSRLKPRSSVVCRSGAGCGRSRSSGPPRTRTAGPGSGSGSAARSCGRSGARR